MNGPAHDETIESIAETLSLKIVQKIHYSTKNLQYCKEIIQAQLSGRIILPHGLGLSLQCYQDLRKAINDEKLTEYEIEWYKDDWQLIRERAAFCDELFSFKEDERQELIKLLISYSNRQDPSSRQMAIIIATASLTNNHLWESLGLSQRKDLGEIIKHNFPELYTLNNKNMRWKRFFYRQLCEQGGDYLCRAPSCEECRSYSECFA